MSARKKGWCPTLDRPMRAGDGWLARLRPPEGTIDAAGARALADAAGKFGNGAVQLTTSAAIQVRGLRDDTLAPFAAAIRAAGLDAPGPAVLWPPLHGDDPAVAPSAAAIARALVLPPVPPKFRVAVDGGGIAPLDGAGADIVVRCDATGAAGATGATGAAGATLHLAGSHMAARVTHGDAAQAVRRLVDSFLAARPTPSRMRMLTAANGGAALFERAGLDARPAPPLPAPPRALGWLPYARGEGGAFGLGLPFGATDADALLAIADRLGAATLRLTPWRALLVAGANARRIGESAGNFVTDPADARARVFACPGAPACGQATVPARADAAIVAAHARGVVHVSGCAKGCAHARTAALTLVGRDGSYDVVHGGRAGDAPVLRGLTIAAAIAALAP